MSLALTVCFRDMSLSKLFSNLFVNNFLKSPERNVSIFAPLNREYRKNKRHNIVLKEDKVPQEKSYEIGPSWIKQCEFPDENTNDRLFNGVRFVDVPIVFIRVSHNNTIFSLKDSILGRIMAYRSCGIEGFKNCKKGTNIAAQATAVTFSSKLKKKGYDQVRISIRGLGPGRMASIKGLEMGGLNIISITDRTPTIFGGNRPRKARRL